MSWLLAHWTELAAAAGALLAAASLITRVTPTPKDDAALRKVRTFLARLSILEPSENHRRMKLPLRKPSPPPHPDDLP